MLFGCACSVVELGVLDLQAARSRKSEKEDDHRDILEDGDSAGRKMRIVMQAQSVGTWNGHSDERELELNTYIR